LSETANCGPAAFGREMRPRVIDEDAPHQLGGDAEELRAILPVGLMLVDQAQVRLVDQRRRLQSMIGSLAAQVTAG